ncbi:MAG: peptide chain release factor 1 [Gemmatimonadetes bacterium]|nr:peptide chain release factor 1 [Gemmatimonadota bacterium]|tara:strand:+ start:112 stop:1191 length:1080 start_codon:yes stop_codon:yes gene_type:complete
MLDKLSEYEQRYEELGTQMADPVVSQNPAQYQKLAREFGDLQEIVDMAAKYREASAQLAEAEEIIADDSEPELVELAEVERGELQGAVAEMEEALKVMLVPKDPNDGRNAIVEIRAGAGGDEAGLFASDLYRMYHRFAERQGLKTEELSSSQNPAGGFKEAVFMVSGKDAFGRLKFESGVHRVQRVPKTEASGRIHTSAASVAVLPEAEDVEVEIAQEDLKIEVYRSSGPGGQSVNTTDSAVKITHGPTGLVVSCQDEKSQLKNKNKALKILRARLYDKIQAEQKAERDATRAGQIGSGDRSDKIRTYNFPQGRVTDHRIKLSLYRLEEVLDGDFDEFVQQLALASQQDALEAAQVGTE